MINYSLCLGPLYEVKSWLACLLEIQSALWVDTDHECGRQQNKSRSATEYFVAQIRTNLTRVLTLYILTRYSNGILLAN